MATLPRTMNDNASCPHSIALALQILIHAVDQARNRMASVRARRAAERQALASQHARPLVAKAPAEQVTDLATAHAKVAQQERPGIGTDVAEKLGHGGTGGTP